MDPVTRILKKLNDSYPVKNKGNHAAILPTGSVELEIHFWVDNNSHYCSVTQEELSDTDKLFASIQEYINTIPK
jgi:hypothetical protein